MFHVGMMVVCVDDRAARYRGHEFPSLTRGQVYTVRFVGRCRASQRAEQGWGLRLEEIVLPEIEWWGGVSEPLYCVTRFRPAKDTDISALRHLLVNPPKDLVSA
jgi:hypothetical protein